MVVYGSNEVGINHTWCGVQGFCYCIFGVQRQLKSDSTYNIDHFIWHRVFCEQYNVSVLLDNRKTHKRDS